MRQTKSKTMIAAFLRPYHAFKTSIGQRKRNHNTPKTAKDIENKIEVVVQQLQVGNDDDDHDPNDTITIAIIGGGIVGLTLALCLRQYVPATNMKIIIYEQAKCFVDDVGAGMGLYPNGLRVLRDIGLLDDCIAVGYPFKYRRWTRHDGKTVAVSNEKVLLRKQQSCCSSNGGGATTGNCTSSVVSDNGEDCSMNEATEDDDLKLQSLGIRRWRLQKLLYDAIRKDSNITIHFNARIHDIVSVATSNNNSNNKNTMTPDTKPQSHKMKLILEDGATSLADIIFGADGGKSRVRDCVLSQPLAVGTAKTSSCTTTPNSMVVVEETNDVVVQPHLQYSGVTCLMGIAENTPQTKSLSSLDDVNAWHSNQFEGISFPSSVTSGCHATIFPTGPTEQCFQFYFPVLEKVAKPGHWGLIEDSIRIEECTSLANQLKQDGWHDSYIKPLQQSTKAMRIGFCLLGPTNLNQFVYSINKGESDSDLPPPPTTGENQTVTEKRIVLVGDAAHPAIPYIGQGAQLGFEDAGTIALLLKHYCYNDRGNKNKNDNDGCAGTLFLNQFTIAMELYEKIRIPRSLVMLEHGKTFGHKQEMRSSCIKNHRDCVETQTKRAIFFHETLPMISDGAQFDYKLSVKDAIDATSNNHSMEN